MLYQRLKVPPAINQFTQSLGKNEAATIFKLFAKYRPETAAVRKQRIKETAAAVAAKKKAPEKPKKRDPVWAPSCLIPCRAEGG